MPRVRAATSVLTRQQTGTAAIAANYSIATRIGITDPSAYCSNGTRCVATPVAG